MIVNEVTEAENKTMLPKLETHLEGVLLRKSSNVPNKTSEDYPNKYQFHDKIKVTKIHVNSNTIKTTTTTATTTTATKQTIQTKFI